MPEAAQTNGSALILSLAGIAPLLHMANAQTPPIVSALEIQNMTSAASADFANAPEANDYHMLKQYLWKLDLLRRASVSVGSAASA